MTARTQKRKNPHGKRLPEGYSELEKIQPSLGGGSLPLQMFPIDLAKLPGYSEIYERLSAIEKKVTIPKISKEVSLEHFAYFCWRAKHEEQDFQLWSNCPTIRKFKEDVETFRRIATRRAGLIPYAAERIVKKYSNLSHISEEYMAWYAWLWRHDISLGHWEELTHGNRHSKKKALALAEKTLSALNDVPMGGASLDAATAWMAGHLITLWRSAKLDPAKDRKNLIWHLGEVLSIVGFRMPPPSTSYRIIANLLEDRVQGHRFSLGPIVYTAPSSLSRFWNNARARLFGGTVKQIDRKSGDLTIYSTSGIFRFITTR